jgi:lysozyme
MTTKQQRVDDLIRWMKARGDLPAPETGVRLIAWEEDCRLSAYPCPAGKPTNGWGETDGVALGMNWTQDYANERFVASLHDYMAKLEGLLSWPATDNQKSALLSLIYNIGVGAFARSTARKLHNKGDFAGCAQAMGWWDKITDKKTGAKIKHPALVARRATEVALYLKPEDDAMPQKAPQAVATEPAMWASPTNLVGIGGTVASAAAVVKDLGAPVGTIADASSAGVAALVSLRDSVASLFGLAPDVVLPLALLLAFGVVLYRRWRQRQHGVA